MSPNNERHTIPEYVYRAVMVRLVLGVVCVLMLASSVQPAAAIGAGGRHKDTVFRFLPVPVLSYNRSIGAIFGAAPLAMYPLSKQDTVSPASISGLFGVYTTNETWMGMAFGRWYLAEDSWRITTAIGGGNIKFQFTPGISGIGSIQYATAAFFGYADVQRNIVGNLYAGLSYIYMEFDTRFDVESDPRLAARLQGLGVVGSFDGRDDVYYPYNGFFSEFNVNLFPTFLGNEASQGRAEVKLNQYLDVRDEQDVIAGRLYGGVGLGALDFQQQFVVGFKDLRGYTQGEYRGDQMVAGQVEYRWNPLPWFGAVAFGGVATVFNAIDEQNNGLLLPAGGAGIRFTVFDEYHMNVGLDAAVGRDDWGVYFRIGEAF